MKDPTHVLLVDDNLGMLETLSDILTSYGFEVSTAVDGQEALGKFKQQEFTVAVVDIILPGINGVELIRQLRPAHPDSHFIVITAYTDSELTRQARDEEVAAIMYKPVDPHQLVTKVKELPGVKTD